MKRVQAFKTNKSKIVKAIVIVVFAFIVSYLISFSMILCALAGVYEVEQIMSLKQALLHVFSSSEIKDIANDTAIIIALLPTIIAALWQFISYSKQPHETKYNKPWPSNTKHKPQNALQKLPQEDYIQTKEDDDALEYNLVLLKMPYKIKSILTGPEKILWQVLQNKLPKDVVLLTKPGLKEFIGTLDYKLGPVSKRAWREIAQKHVDFLVCNKNMYPLYAIEYDGDTHEGDNPANAATIKSDEFKNRLFGHVDLPLFRIKYAPEKELEIKVDELLYKYSYYKDHSKISNNSENKDHSEDGKRMKDMVSAMKDSYIKTAEDYLKRKELDKNAKLAKVIYLNTDTK